MGQGKLVDEREYQMECEEYLFKRLEKISGFERVLASELEQKYGLWVGVGEAMKILGRGRSTIYRYKEENSIIYRQNGRKILIYTKSLIFVM